MLQNRGHHLLLNKNTHKQTDTKQKRKASHLRVGETKYFSSNMSAILWLKGSGESFFSADCPSRLAALHPPSPHKALSLDLRVAKEGADRRHAFSTG